MNFNPMEMMKNLQGMQQKMKDFKGKVSTYQETGSAGGDMVRVTMNGEFAVIDVTLSPEVVDPEDREMLQDLIKAASLDAQRKIKERLQQEMKELTGGLPMDQFSGMMGL